METLYSWTAKRAGGRITITHSCGKIANVESIEPCENGVLAKVVDGRIFALHIPNTKGK